MATRDQLAEFRLFSGITAAELDAVLDAASDVAFAAGTRLFDEGQPASGCWLIRSGRVSLETHVPGRGQVAVQTLDSGDILGWSWLVAPQQWHLTATAVEPVTAVELDTDRLRALAEQDPRFGYQLAVGMFEVLLDRLQSTRARLLDLYGSPRER